MTQLLATVETRISAVLESGRGSSGMSAAAAQRAIPTGRFRRSHSGAPLDDPSYPLEAFDRAYEILWTGESELPESGRDELNSSAFSVFAFDLRVGYLYGSALSAFKSIDTTTTEVAATLVTRVRRQALSEARTLILRALTYQEIVSDSMISAIDRPISSSTSLLDLGSGRLLCVIPLRAFVWYSQTSNYDD